MASASPVKAAAWYNLFAAQTASAIETAFQQGASDVVVVGVQVGYSLSFYCTASCLSQQRTVCRALISPRTTCQADSGKNFATREEWTALQLDIQKGFADGKIRGEWEDVEFTLLASKKVAGVVERATGDTFVIIASCPSHHFDLVRNAAGKNRNVTLSFGRADDIGGSLTQQTAGLSVSGGAHGAPSVGRTHGTKQWTSPDGNVGTFVGDLLNGKADGKGIWTVTAGESKGAVYDGEWKDDTMHGRGTLKWPSGGVYEGEWKNDTMHGRGTNTQPDGSVYEGEFKDDRPHGRGTYKYADGHVYEGEWKDGKMHGRGTFKYADGRVQSGNLKDGAFIE
jgi:hypothetical protein